MPANNTGLRVGILVGRYPGLVGHLYSPGGEVGPFPEVPYALDNGAFGAFAKRQPFDAGAWRALLAWAAESGQRPRWCLVPDVVGDRLGTLRAWDTYAPEAAARGWPLAFAAQDGMSPEDAPPQASVIFLGGSTEWKRAAIHPWCARFPRVHVGRINTYRWLRICEDAGAESVDGTGWMRGDQDQLRGLEQWLREASGESAREDQTSLSFDDSDEPTAATSRSSETPAPAPCGVASTPSPASNP